LPQRDFGKLLLESVDEALTSLGESSKQAIYFHLEKSFSIRKDEIPSEVEDFAEAIEKTFGLGARFLEILIIKCLSEKTGTVVAFDDSKDFTFTKYIALAKQGYEEKDGATTEGVIGCEEIELDL
jgi:hypothetical protein